MGTCRATSTTNDNTVGLPLSSEFSCGFSQQLWRQSARSRSIDMDSGQNQFGALKPDVGNHFDRDIPNDTLNIERCPILLKNLDIDGGTIGHARHLR